METISVARGGGGQGGQGAAAPPPPNNAHLEILSVHVSRQACHLYRQSI